MTVSRALRNDLSSNSQATVERIQRVAKELGYSPDPVISGLMNHLRLNSQESTSLPIAFITCFESEKGWRRPPNNVRLYEGAQERAQQFGYKLETHWLKQKGMTPRRLSDILLNRGIRGVVVCPLSEVGILKGFAWSSFAWVTMGHSLREPKMHKACSNQFQSMDLAFKRCVEYGYKRIGLLSVSGIDQRVSNRYLSAYHFHQAQLPPESRVPPYAYKQMGEKGISEWAARHKPDAVILSDMSSKLVQCLREAGDPNCAYMVLNVDTIDQQDTAGIFHNPKEVGAAAIDLLDVQLKNNLYGLPKLPRHLNIECEWVDGPSLPKIRRKRKSAAAITE